MSKSELRKHKLVDSIKWIVTGLLLIGLLGAVIALFVKLDRQTSITTIGNEAFIVGGIDAEGNIDKEDTSSIVMRSAASVDGISVELVDTDIVTYELFYYDDNGDFISSTGTLSADFDGEIAEGAETFNIVITPIDDEEVTFFEVYDYAAQIKITVNR